MLRLSIVLHTAAAAALFAATPSYAQSGLGDRITDAGTKLDQDVQACRPVDLGEAQRLLHEAALNKQRAAKAAKKGVPVDQAQVDADLANASALFNRAQAALVQQCLRQAQQPATQPQPRATGALPGATPAVGQTGGQSCAPTQTPAAASSDGPRIPTSDEIHRMGDAMETAAEAGKQGEADFHLRSFDDMAAGLRKTISDAKKVGEFSTVDVQEAEKRLKEIEDWRKAGEKHRLPCQPEIKRPTQTSMALPSWARDILAAHNAARSAVGAPPLQWNPGLQAHATARAGELAQVRQLVHAPREGRGTERENILSAPIGYSPDRMIDLWSKESRHFRPGLFPDVSDTGNWMDVAHYTQMVWPTTTDIGCGYAPGGGFNWLVCRYNPGGNKDGKPVLAQTPGFQVGAGMERQVTEAPRGQTPPASKLDPDLRVRQDWGAQQISEMAKAHNAASGGMAMDVSKEPNPAVIHLLGDGILYGDLLPSDASGALFNPDYDREPGLFVGYDLGAVRIDADAAYKRPGTSSLFDLGIYAGGAWGPDWFDLPSDDPAGTDTKVERPELPNKEVYKPIQPDKLEDPM